MLDKRRFRKNRVLVFQEKRSYTHLNDNGYSEKVPLKQMELGGKSMRKSKMRNKPKDPSYHIKWAEIGKDADKVAHFGTFSTNITTWLHKDQIYLEISTKTISKDQI